MFIPPHSIDLTPYLSAKQQFPALFQTRPIDSHKGTFGTLGLIGGTTGMSGALVLAATAAIYSGCGKVWAGFQQPSLPMPLIPDRPEIMLSTAIQLQQRDDISAWVCGCGLGLQENAYQVLQQQLAFPQPKPLLLDADALTLLAHYPELAQAARHYPHLIITPHPSEAARLLHTTTSQIQADRLNAVKKLAEQFQAIAVLKGHQTLIATPDGNIYQNQSGNAGLATAGSGDVLCGMMGALLAQGIAPYEAAQCGIWLHGAAADALKTLYVGEIGMLSGEIVLAARWLRNRLLAE